MSAWGPCTFARNSAKTLFLLLPLALIVAVPALASDTQPPVLTSFSFSPTSIDTTVNSATVNLSGQMTDDLSGVSGAYMYFSSPSGRQAASADMYLISGTNLNGTYAGTVNFPALGEA